MRLLSACLVILTAAAALPAYAETYTLDSDHTNVLFMVNHLGFSDMVGRFDGTVGQFDFDSAKPEASKVDVTLRPANIHTSSPKLDEHLQSADFFNSAQYPEIRFVSTGVKVTGASDGQLMGNLTLLGVTKPVTLNVHFNKEGTHPMTGQKVAGFTATASLKRSDFGMAKYIPMVGDDVRLLINTEGVVKTVAPQTGKKAD